MPAIDSAAFIVARFLKAHNYIQSYQAFIHEASLPEDAGDLSNTSMTLERLLEEKRLFDQSINFERLSLIDTPDQGWAARAPSSPLVIESLPSKSNLLHVLHHKHAGQDLLFASTSDRKISVVVLPDMRLKSCWSDVVDSPVLAQLVIKDHHISASMSGSVMVVNIATGQVVDRRKDHSKYVIALTGITVAQDYLLASAGWDNVINIYRVGLICDPWILGEPIASVKLQTKPESIAFAIRPQTKEPILVVSRTDSSHLYFYAVSNGLALIGRQNLAPNSNAWVAFTPSSIAMHPTDSTIIAVGTNSVPHMKLIVADLLIPTLTNDDQPKPLTARDEALADQAVADREDRAIKLHCNTMSAQTPYSSPLVVWRPDGQGVWVNGDDGLIRGIDVKSGKTILQLHCHDVGSKVRTLLAVKDISGAERLISGGFDQKLILWSPGST